MMKSVNQYCVGVLYENRTVSDHDVGCVFLSFLPVPLCDEKFADTCCDGDCLSWLTWFNFLFDPGLQQSVSWAERDPT